MENFVFCHWNLLLYLAPVFTDASSVYFFGKRKQGGLQKQNHDTKGAVAIMEKAPKYSEIKTVKTSDNKLSQQTLGLQSCFKTLKRIRQLRSAYSMCSFVLRQWHF